MKARIENIGKILVIGSSGYVGTVLTRYLSRKGYEIHTQDLMWFESVLSDVNIPEETSASHNVLDIRDIKSKDLEGFDIVILLSAV